MSSPPPFTGYVPRFEMPVIAPPPANYQGALLDYYQQLEIDLGLAMSGPNNEFVDITLAKAANATNSIPVDATLFAMTGGFVRHYPNGTVVPSPDSFTSPPEGVLVLTVWLEDIATQQRAFPADTPAMGYIYYVGVDQTQTSAILRTETAKMSDAALRASWKDQQGAAPAAGTTLDDLIDQHNARVMMGLGAVFVDGGTPIGKAAQDPTTSVETYRFTLRMTGGGNPVTYVSPVPIFTGAPYYDL